ncbi:hypothetical protein IMZ31_23965 (plasmid) [Pontibacillus sp. ALD_SL1]|uniref:hypothetical protein n=1 Tax=Pontibacillus sp. ALD_SL1 TaxID=2777185 RepID=UPI001A9670C1|nr:hypothetical protein [Pontibacillus sp. ALD_SL1]QST02509.1 hypothetical protein IMZ31_23965 [Pontibacillus sp. ALD_SL1]
MTNIPKNQIVVRKRKKTATRYYINVSDTEEEGFIYERDSSWFCSKGKILVKEAIGNGATILFPRESLKEMSERDYKMGVALYENLNHIEEQGTYIDMMLQKYKRNPL